MDPSARRDDPALIGLAASLELSPAVVASRLSVLGLDGAARARLRALAPLARERAPGFLDAFYDRLAHCPSTRAWLGSPALVERLKGQQRGYLQELFEGELDFSHALRCLQIGVAHHRVRLTPQWFVASHGHFVCAHLPLIFEAAGSHDEAIALVVTLLESVLFDASLVLDGYALSAEQSVRAQRVGGQRAGLSSPPIAVSAASSVVPPPATRARVASDEASERAAFLGIDEATSAELRALAPLAEQALPEVLAQFYALVSTWEETRDLVPPAVVERLKRQVGSYWTELFRGDFDRAYAASRTLIGVVHERIGLSSPRYLIGLARQTASLLRHVVPRAASPLQAADALLRAVFFDVSFVLQAYVDARAEAVLRTDGFAAELLAGLTAGVAVVDARMRVEAVNPALLSLFGLEAGLVRFVQLSELLPLPGAVDLVRRAWEAPGQRFTAVVEREGRAFRATALHLSAPSQPAKDSVALVLDEITDIVRIHAEAQQAERDHVRVIETVQALLWEADPETFTLSLVSRCALEVTGYRDVALLGRPHAFTRLIPEPDRRGFIACCRALTVGGKTEIHHRLLKADGSTVWLRSAVGCVPGVDGAPLLCGVSVDITESRLEEQRRLDAIGRLAGGIAHEYNNRLTVILTSLSMVGPTGLDEGSGELLREAASAAERCALLTRQILTFAQRQVLRPQPVILNELLGSARKSIAQALGAAVELELRLAPDLWRCRVDAKELEAAIESLVANARDSMRGGGRLTVSTRNVPANDRGHSPETAGQDLVEVAVEDTGTGMEEGVKRRAFEPFFTTKPSAHGLGLSIVHGFVAQSGGTVSLASKSGNGTVVRLLFPRLDEPRAPPRGEAEAEAERPFVLAVDDEPSLRLVLQNLLQRSGYAVVAVGTIAEALAVLRARRVDVLVTDVVLADGESGARLAPEARLLQPELPVIYVSGFTREELDLEALGPRDWFLAKPFSVAEMRDALREATGKAPSREKRGA